MRFVTSNRTFATGNTDRNFSLLGWSPLQERRARLKVTMLFKIKNDLIEISKDNLSTTTNARRKHNFQVPYSKLEIHKNSFYPSAIRLWNNLPNHIKEISDLLEFKNQISEISFSKITQRDKFYVYYK